MADEVLTQPRRSPSSTITFNRPEVYNAFNRDLHAALREALTEAGDASVRCVVVTGAGKGFCAGQDLKEFGEVSGAIDEALEQTYHPNVRLIRSLQKPVIAAVNGAGGGRGPLVRLRVRPPGRVGRGDLRPRLHRDRPRAGRGRHVVHPPAARVRAGIRVDVLERAALRRRRARVGARLRGDPGRRVRDAGRRARRRVGVAPDGRGRPHEAALRPRVGRRARGPARAGGRLQQESRRERGLQPRASAPSSRSARRDFTGA